MPQKHTPQQSRGEMTSCTRLLPVQSVNDEARTAELVWTTGARVKRYDWMNDRYYWEELSTERDAVDMSRLQAGAPLLNSHWRYSLNDVIGVVESASVDGNEGRAVVRFSERADVEPIFQDVRGGIVRNVSVGYAIHEMDRIPPSGDESLWTYRAVRWQPFEISLVAVGADAGAGVRSAGGDQQGNAPVNPCVFNDFHHPADSANRSEEGHMAKEEKAENKAAETKEETRQPAAQQPDQAAIEAARAEGRRLEAERQAVVRQVCRTLNLGDDFSRSLMDDTSLTVEQVRERALNEAARVSESTQGRAVAITTERDEQDVRRQAIADAVAHRANPSMQLPEAARRYRGMSLLEAARRSLEEQGVRTDGMSRMQIAGLALGNSDEHGFRALHGTSDFAIALANTAARTLRSAYESAPRTFTAWARRGTLSDFRAATRVAVAANLSLEKVNEHGEFKRGKIVDAGESIQLATYGKVIGITRQAIINDDLDMFGRIPAMYGRAAADFESDTVYSILTANAAMSDGVALFHANHGNLGSAGAPSETTFAEMRKLARLQKDPSGNGQPLNLTIRSVIVPAALETAAQKILQAVIVATKSADTNPFNGAYQLIVEPRLDANSVTAWYGAADPAAIDTVEYAYLEGEEGLYTEQRMGFDVDGIEIKGRLDFAAKAIDHRGLFKNAGA